MHHPSYRPLSFVLAFLPLALTFAWQNFIPVAQAPHSLDGTPHVLGLSARRDVPPSMIDAGQARASIPPTADHAQIPSRAPAASFTVTTTNDSGVGSLRQAILDSNAAGGSNTIGFSLTYPATITLSSALPSITTTVSINGPGASNLAVSGNNAFRVFDTFSPITLNISGLTVRDGVVINNDGGGIRSNSASAQVSLIGVNVISNTATGGSPGRGGGVFLAGGLVTVTNSLFMNNVASGPMGGGGINLFGGLMTISNTTFTGNRATGGAGGAISNANTGTLRVSASTFFSNTATGGGAVGMVSSNFFTNTTFVGNSAPSFGGAILLSAGNAQFVNSTIYGNSGDHALYKAGGTFTVTNSIVAFPTMGDNCFGVANGDNNIDSGTSCGWGSLNGSMSSTNPKLGPLANNGGATQTMRLLPGSPAIDGVTFNAPNGCPATDQRGIPRPQGARCDIGAYEFVGRVFLPIILRP